MTFQAYDEMLSETAVDRVISDGRVILRYAQAKTERLARDAELRTLKRTGDRVFALNTQSFISEVGNILATRPEARFSLSYFYDFERRTNVCSLRASSDKDVDVSEIAKLFGGGGHAKAAGFTHAGDIEQLFEQE